MHEMAVAENIIEIIQKKFQESGEKGEIKKVNLKIGKLTCVEPEALRLSFEALSRETPLEKTTLSIDSVSIVGKCKDCKKDIRLDKMDFCCPFCESFRIEIKKGRELFIESFEVE